MYRFIASVVMALFVLVASYNMAYALEIKKYTWIDFETKMQWLKEDMNMCV